MTMKKSRDIRVHSSLSRSEVSTLDSVAARDGSNRSTIIRAALLYYFDFRQGAESRAVRQVTKRGRRNSARHAT